ncbi:hypothetical protein [Mesobacillus subterraneus]|uniref:hypothetical protein n=1 Tax=Mesobacillus subterraneus TaxID=285983 RepID=UPI000B03E039|nr:hypothetical protein [Mesobacillus subterraneus]
MTLVPLLFLGGFNLVIINISELQESSAIKGWIYTAEGFAFMTGAFLIKRISHKYSPYKILFSSSMLIGFSQLMLYFADQPVLTIVSFLIFGFSVGVFSRLLRQSSKRGCQRISMAASSRSET